MRTCDPGWALKRLNNKYKGETGESNPRMEAKKRKLRLPNPPEGLKSRRRKTRNGRGPEGGGNSEGKQEAEGKGGSCGEIPRGDTFQYFTVEPLGKGNAGIGERGPRENNVFKGLRPAKGICEDRRRAEVGRGDLPKKNPKKLPAQERTGKGRPCPPANGERSEMKVGFFKV